MRISIIGSGVVGEATGSGFEKFGHKTIFCDIDDKRLANLRDEGYEVTQDIERVRALTNRDKQNKL